METTAQREVDLHGGVGQELSRMGHPADTVPAQERPVFGAEDVVEVLGNTVRNPIEDTLSGKEGLEKGVRVSPSRRFGSWVIDRFRRKQK